MDFSDENKGEQREERRKCPRKEIFAKVSYRVIAPSGGGGILRNISEEGVCIILDRELPIGTIIELRFDLPGEEAIPIETYAKVIWQKIMNESFLTGVKFGT